nr:MAG TPA: hypothetical protein [Caudoviricetes sp.]
MVSCTKIVCILLYVAVIITVNKLKERIKQWKTS